jgi:hypothetical protein
LLESIGDVIDRVLARLPCGDTALATLLTESANRRAALRAAMERHDTDHDTGRRAIVGTIDGDTWSEEGADADKVRPTAT